MNGDQEWLGQLQAIFNCRNYAMPKTTLYVLVRWHVMTPQVLAGAEMAVSKWEGEEGLPASYPVILALSFDLPSSCHAQPAVRLGALEMFVHNHLYG